MENNNVGFWEYNIEKNTFYFSNELYEIMEVSHEIKLDGFKEMLDHYMVNYRSKDYDVICKAFDDCVKIGKSYSHTFQRQKSDNQVWIRTKGQALSFNGEIQKVVGCFEEITIGEKELETALILKQKAEEKDRLKTEFLHSLSHDIRTPLNSIIGFSKLFKKPELTEEKRSFYADLVIKSSEQILSMVNDILSISKIETGKIQLNPEYLNINNLLYEVFCFFNPIAQEKKIKLLLNKSLPDNESNILTDKTRLTQVLNNLINNALKYTTEGKISFGYTYSTKNEIPVLEFYVQDTGSGIKEENIELVFEPFRQEETDLNKHYGGTGLGLSIASKLIEVMGGKLWLDTFYGKGSTFYFTLPFKTINTN